MKSLRRLVVPGQAAIAVWGDAPARPLLVYVAVASFAVLLSLSPGLLPSWSGFLAASALPLIGIVVGVRRHRPAVVMPWLVLWAGQAAFLVGDVLTFGREAGVGSGTLAALGDVAYLTGYPLVALSLGMFIHWRLPAFRLAPLVDAIAVGVAGIMVLWLVHVEPAIHQRPLDTADILILLAYPIADVLLLGAVAYLLVGARTIGVAAILLASSICLLLGADILSATASTTSREAWADVLWAASYVLVGAAAMVPSMRELTEPAPAHAWLVTRKHMVVLLTALLVLPATAALQVFAVGHLHGEVLLLAAVLLGVMLVMSVHDAARTTAREQRRWATVLARASDAFALTTPDGTFTYVSPASEQVLGSTSAELIGTSVYSLRERVHPADRDGPASRLAEAVSTIGATARERLRVMTPDGLVRWLDVTGRNLADDPDIRGAILNYRDITGEVLAASELERRDRLLATAEAITHTGSAEWHLTSGEGTLSPGMWALLGLEPDSLAMDETAFFERVHPEDIPRLLSAYSALRARQLRVALDFRIVRPDGSMVEVHGIGEVGLAGDGNPDRVVATFVDVTAERQVKRQLQAQADILASVREAIVVTDLDGKVTFWANGAATLFGYRPDEMLGRSLEVIYPTDASAILGELSEMRRGSVGMNDVHARRSDRSEIVVDVRSTVMWATDGEPTGYISLAIDATARHAAQKSLARLWTAIDQSSESVVITDAEARIEYVNPAFERITGYARDEVIGRNPSILKSGVQSEAFYRSMWASLLAGEPWKADLVNRRKDGSVFEEEAAISPITDASGQLSGFVAVKRDVTEERRLEADAVRVARERTLIAQTIRDIKGDETPEVIAEAVGRQLSRLSDVSTAGLFIFGAEGRAAPYGFTVGGDPFSGLGPVPGRRSRYQRAQAVRGPWIAAWEDRPWHPYNRVFLDAGVTAIAYAPVSHAGQVIGFLHISATGAQSQEVLAMNMPALVEFAEITGALLGGSLVAINASEAARLGISRIIKGNAFMPVFQPIVDITRGEVVGYEGLTRFRDRVRPDVRFAEAERAGLGRELELATLEAALAASEELPAGMWLNLNVSPQMIIQSVALAGLLAQTRRQVVLEITEHEEIEDYARFRAAVERLGPNVLIAVDDAGSGYASLRHILEIRPALVKLDRGLIVGIEVDHARRALVAGMQRFAGDANIRLIAEGVETQAELDTLRDLAIELSQGFLLGRPRPLWGSRRRAPGGRRPSGTGPERQTPGGIILP